MSDGIARDNARQNEFFSRPGTPQWEADKVAARLQGEKDALEAGHEEFCIHFQAGTAYNGMDYDRGDIECNCGKEG